MTCADFSDDWIAYFMAVALVTSKKSKDPRTKVGCVIVNADKQVLSVGFNGFPRVFPDDPELLNDRETKLHYVVHAEANAVCSAAALGHALKGSYAFVTKYPCSHCAGLLVQAGVVGVFCPTIPEGSKWGEDSGWASITLRDSGVEVCELTGDGL